MLKQGDIWSKYWKSKSNDIMYLSFFDYTKGRIEYVKDAPNFIKEFGKDFMRAYQEEMEYTAYKAIIDTSIDLNAELDRIENEYSFNEDMQILLSVVSPSVRWAVMTNHSDLLRWSKESKEAEAQVKEYCRLIMEDLARSVEVNIEPKYYRMDDETDKILKDLKAILRKGVDK